MYKEVKYVKKLWHPILFDPIIFDKKIEDQEEHPDQFSQSKTLIPEGEKPSFCNGEVNADMQESMHLPTATTEESSQIEVNPSLESLPIPSHLLSLVGRKTKETTQKQRTPKPYDVAMELMRCLPLRMIDNALYAFDGKIYRFVSTDIMYRIIMANCRHHVAVVGDASLIERVYKIIQAEPTIVLNKLPIQKRYVALEDGLLDLQTMSLIPHTAEIFVTTLLNGSFSRGSTMPCPHFSKFLNDISGGDQKLIERIWQMIGYVLVPDNAGKCLFLLQGVPDSGKSLLANLISSLLDEENVTSIDLTALGERFGASVLLGKQLCLVPDMPSGVLDSKSVSMLKALTGGDTVTVDVKYQPRIKMRYHGTFVLVSNHAVITRDNDPAFFNRVVVIPFRFSIPKENQIFDLQEALYMEKDSIIFNSLLAYKRLQERKYIFSGTYEVNQSITTEKLQNVSLTDLLSEFCRIYLYLEPGSFLSTTDIFTQFQTATGTIFPGGIGAFSTRISIIIAQMFPDQVERKRTRMTGSGRQERGFSGIGMKSYFDRKVGV